MSIPSGFLLINKPSGPTSHDIVDELRRITGERRIGHAGTLDPFASGLLIVAVGREATKRIAQFAKLDKTYIAKIHLGEISDTYDKTGAIRKFSIFNFQFSKKDIEETLQKFVGEQKQVPPMYSAKKIGGKKLYELARKGIEIERKPVDINIHYIKVLEFITPPVPSYLKRGDNIDDAPHLILETRVSSGTYIRSLANDIGTALGCGAYLEELTRTEIGGYKLEQATRINELTSNNWHNSLFQV